MSSTHCVLWAPKRFRVIRKATESSVSIGLFAADSAFVDSPDDPEYGLLVAEAEHSFLCLFSNSFGSFCANTLIIEIGSLRGDLSNFLHPSLRFVKVSHFL